MSWSTQHFRSFLHKLSQYGLSRGNSSTHFAAFVRTVSSLSWSWPVLRQRLHLHLVTKMTSMTMAMTIPLVLREILRWLCFYDRCSVGLDASKIPSAQDETEMY